MQKVALVTGSTGGIGCAIVEELVNNGFTVVAHYHKNAEKAAYFTQKYPDRVFAVQGDLSTVQSAELFAEKVVSNYPHINVLINNAGISEIGLFTDSKAEDLAAMINTNLTSALIVTNAVAKNMIRDRYGKIVNISSIWGVYGGSCEVSYSASKGGIIAFTKALSKELGLSNINVNCIAPGFIDTAMNAHLSEEEKQSFIESVSLNRQGRPEDVAKAVAFLAGDDSSYITGQVIGVDGGI